MTYDKKVDGKLNLRAGLASILGENRGCSDHGCIYGGPSGMGTNGGCAHLKMDLVETRRELRKMAELARLLWIELRDVRSGS